MAHVDIGKLMLFFDLLYDNTHSVLGKTVQSHTSIFILIEISFALMLGAPERTDNLVLH